jgi:hypothetical protein
LLRTIEQSENFEVNKYKYTNIAGTIHLFNNYIILLGQPGNFALMNAAPRVRRDYQVTNILKI